MARERAAYDKVHIEVLDRRSGRVWMVRWRQPELEGGVELVRKKCVTTYSLAEAQQLELDVRRALRERGWWEAPAKTAKPEVVLVSAEDAFLRWLEEEIRGRKGRADGTVTKYAQSLDRWFGLLREELAVPAGQAVLATALHRDLVGRAIVRMRAAKLSDGTIYATISHALLAWRWVAGRPDRWPGIPACPDPSSVLPDPPTYSAPPAPTLAEVDAVLRRLGENAYVARYAAIIMRFTGLRISQTLAIRREDLDERRRMLTIRLGKGRRETEGRVVPVSAHLIEELKGVLGEAGTSLVPRRSDLRAPNNKNHIPSTTLNDAWEAAVADDEVRREVWRPTNRKIGRPEHAFRAALQDYLEDHGVKEKVVDRLVGHAPQGVRARHYVPPKDAELREAVDLLPPIDWTPKPR